MRSKVIGSGPEGVARTLASRLLVAITASLLVFAGLGQLVTPATGDAQVSSPRAALADWLTSSPARCRRTES